MEKLAVDFLVSQLLNYKFSYNYLLLLLIYFSFFFPAAKPIDLLAQYISTEVEDLDIQMHEPYRILVVSTCS